MPIGLCILLLILSLVYKGLSNQRRIILAVNMGLAFAAIITNIIKISVKRIRPCHDPYVSTLFFLLTTSDHYSFPSGHSSSIWAMMTPIIDKSNRKWAKILALVIGVYIPFTRVYLGVHYFSDVIIGSILGSVAWFISKRIFLTPIQENNIKTESTKST
ncbi:MAG: phosphatase PAP2 family protein [Candidatus Lokiarchaeota archaeon]|nr:phosphatase PAP2 family protein [Candidatus Lokiarchaeota archaeon]